MVYKRNAQTPATDEQQCQELVRKANEESPKPFAWLGTFLFGVVLNQEFNQQAAVQPPTSICYNS
jgi:hypothetical protein